MKIGVLAMQGAYREHLKILRSLGVDTIDVRYEEDIDDIDGLIIPGGESTTMGKLIKTLGLFDKLKTRIEDNMPVWGTCAGMILLAKDIVNEDYNHLAVMDINVVRNAYGRQLGSFETKAPVKDIGEDIDMVFIRAPYIESVGKNVEVLSTVDGNIVAAQEENMLVTSFHPELTDDFRLHKYFINIVAKSINDINCIVAL
ncbi:MAG: pyridoxal 5'-phosphate synthase glutaminase subunit PdxT [Intestinibacter bartlettii]|uniref:pyridoxal 5'-phosphate synthase glutaminase subunit PdxT n=1 Tax=Intestinibacter bartlettii TaxID=261299 RepID=UPI0026E97CAA|nr:pyridoxal 5'-phosphate synthase glutaminase subunit PdxT [Intestinibacter bartlettii]MDO5010829.1 pyridoxal 5'-phosphate synthase glutaminase subunit PdxT [Intestinibacter bartlettii]